MNVLVTGITGSGGSYLAEYIIENHPDVKVFGLHRWHSAGSLSNIENIKDRIIIIEADLLDLSSVIRALQIIKPDRIFHLAAFANVKKCFDTPLAVINNNIMGTANLFEAVRIVCPETLIQFCSTSEVYGNPSIYPMREDHPRIPVNPYAVSKLSGETLAYSYVQSFNLRIINTRAFAYINPRRKDLFATAFACQIARIEVGKQDILHHGNLDSIRTLVDVRDICEAYWLACDKCEIGESYNVGGKDSLSVGDFLNILIKNAKTYITTEQDKNLLRPVDVTKQIPDTEKFYLATGWTPKYSLEDSVQWLLDTVRKEVK